VRDSDSPGPTVSIVDAALIVPVDRGAVVSTPVGAESIRVPQVRPERNDQYTPLQVARGDHNPLQRASVPGRRPRPLAESVVAAYYHDWAGRPLKSIADEFGVGDANDPDDVRAIRNYVADGRRELNRRGALPWALADDGIVPSDWRDHAEYAEVWQQWKEGRVWTSGPNWDWRPQS
jgi:hypothetical protein